MDLKEIKRVIQMVEEAQISHLSIESEGVKIEVKKEYQHQPAQFNYHHQIQAPQAIPASNNTPTTEPTPPAKDEKLVAIKSQMVGTFYSAPKPEAPAFIKVGDTLSSGQTICIIEAMKLFNEIEAEINGVVEKICVQNGDPIQYGQELFLIRTQ